MNISQQNVQQLAALYERRRQLSTAHRAAEYNFWVGVINDGFARTSGARLALMDALGGRGPLIELFAAAVDEKAASIRDEIDAEIRSLGGEP